LRGARTRHILQTMRPLLLLALILGGCAALAPRPVTVESRLAALPMAAPVAQPVTIRWNVQMVPWIEAQSDEDLAFALGVVHGHLRGAQIALLRLASQGRLAEVAGPPAADIDHALRALGFGRAAPAIIAAWPGETRRFAQRFVDGLNHATLRPARRPPEAGLLGLRREPYTPEQLLALGRLAGTDVNRLSWFALLPERERADFRQTWARVLEAGSGAVPIEDPLAQILATSSRAGSNTVAVAGRRSATGGALIANDPHLGMFLPNLWLVAGMRSPSFHAVGAMVPGLPFIGFGRNPDLAWGGTNMRAASSELFDVSGLPPEAFRTEEARIRQRLWFSTTRRYRMTEHGPVITDAPILPGRDLALRWIGHEPTDEITALLAGARARDGATFEAAFRNFGVSAQNMLWADRAGNIGRFMAATLPDRPGFRASGPVLDATNPAHTQPWRNLRDARTLPRLVNPPEGVLASANENPREWTTNPPPVGYFFSDGDRVQRLTAVLMERPRISVADMQALQRDTLAPRARVVAHGLIARLDALPGGAPEAGFLAPLRGWDGDYAASARAPVVFELLISRLVRALSGEARALAPRGPETGWNFITAFLLRDLDALDPARREAILRQSAREAAALSAPGAVWGDLHRLRPAHLLGQIPVIGERFVLGDHPVGGSRETPMKTSHGLIEGRHNVTFGSMARHVSDMSDPDANWFVLWGVQDGWLGSAAFADQVPMWREGRMVRLPLRAETVAAEFQHVTRLTPAR
jgi:penicillin amidase